MLELLGPRAAPPPGQHVTFRYDNPMNHTYRPAHPLDGFVDRFWLIDDFRRPHPRERVLPSATLDLVIDLTPGARSTALVAGAHAAPFTYSTGRTTALLGVAFRPGGAAPLLDT